MDSRSLLRDLVSRPLAVTVQLRTNLTPDILNVHAGGHDNSIAWLLWHTGREIDMQISAMSGEQEVWTAQGFRDRLNLGGNADEMGYGHSPQEARAITSDDPQALLDYVDASVQALDSWVARLTPEALDVIVDDAWDPPVNRASRIVSVVVDALEHLAQVGYVQGMHAQR